MSLAMPHVKELLRELRENDWYITAYPFSFHEHDYVVVFEDLREVNKGTKYFAVCLTFIDRVNSNRRLETYVNSHHFSKDYDELMEFFGVNPHGIGGDSPLWELYNEFNTATPDEFAPLEKCYEKQVLQIIDHRENDEGFCCYMARHNKKKANGEQIKRTGKNTAKTRILRPSLFELIGNDKTISFCYRKENELDDATILSGLKNSKSSTV